MTSAYRSFLKKYPEYENPELDALRLKDYPLLNEITYADCTGAMPAPKSLIEKHSLFLTSNLLGNPHSTNTPSLLSTEIIERTRRRILNFFKARQTEYDVIFTSGATGAILLLQHYFSEGQRLLMLADNHNSVNGLREILKKPQGTAHYAYAPINKKLQINSMALKQMLTGVHGKKLFAYPLKSNATGIIHSPVWVNFAQGNGWSTLLDTAAYLGNNNLDLSVLQPDFVPISFYKMFGYPTGLGCLIVKRGMYLAMKKRWFSGGNIESVSIANDHFVMARSKNAHFEDGTVHFSGIPAISSGLDFREGLGDVSSRPKILASWLHDQLSAMSFGGNGVRIYSPEGTDTINLNLWKEGRIFNPNVFEEIANSKKVYIRAGCFCNPGIAEATGGYGQRDSSQGAIRISLGYINNFTDVENIASFIKYFLKN